MTLKEIADQVTDLEALPREAALVTMKLLGVNLGDELNKTWFSDPESQAYVPHWSSLFERIFALEHGKSLRSAQLGKTASLAEQEQAIA